MSNKALFIFDPNYLEIICLYMCDVNLLCLLPICGQVRLVVETSKILSQACFRHEVMYKVVAKALDSGGRKATCSELDVYLNIKAFIGKCAFFQQNEHAFSVREHVFIFATFAMCSVQQMVV